MDTTISNNGTELVKRSAQELAMPAFSIEQAISRRNEMIQFVQQIMVKDVDFGKVPGTEKNTLLKAGAEKLATFFGLSTRFELVERVEDWTGKDHGGEALFYYLYRCRMFRGDAQIAESDGSCNSRESKYRWRWVSERDLPPGVDRTRLTSRSGSIREPAFAIDKRETSGKYGKPESYWNKFSDAIADGTARRVEVPKKDGKTMQAWEIGETMYRVPNEDVAGLLNTIQKMAQKRALVGTTLLAVNASEYFTQDVEDMDLIDLPGAAPRTAPRDADHDKAASDDVAFVVDANGEPDLSHDETFFSEWDRVLASRRLKLADGKSVNPASGRRFIEILMKKYQVEAAKSEWRLDKLQRLSAGDYDATLRGEKVAKPNAEAPKETPQETATGPTRADMANEDSFWAWMADVCPDNSIEDVQAAVDSYAKSVKRTHDTLSPDARLRVYVAAKEGRFTIPGGQIVTEKPAPAEQLAGASA